MKGWELVHLKDVCKLINGRAYNQAELLHEGKYPVLRVGNFFSNRSWYYSDLELDENKYCDDGDLLYAWSASFGPRIWQGGKVIYHYHIWKTDLDLDRVYKRFLYYWFEWDTKRIKSEQGVGTTMIHVTKGAMEDRSLYLPPLLEQKQIVSIVDQAFEGIDGAIVNTKENLTNARELFESYLNATFTQKGDGWIESKLSAVCKFQGGSQPPKSVFSAEKKEDYIRLIQIRDYKSDKYIVYIPKEKAKRFCKPDDVMIGRYGPPLFQILRGLEGAYNVALMKAIPNEEFVSKDFLFYFLKNRNILKYIINSSSRTAGQTGLNKVTIEPYPIAFPTLEKQAIIVAQLQELKAETQRLETIYQQKLAALNELKQSILQKAFTGELTADTANQTTKKAEEAIAA